MATDQHHVIIGNGVAGNQAAAVLRERDPDNRITIISIGGLLFYDRYQLPQVFQGKRDWRDFLVYPPEYYEDHRITVRRKCRVTQVDPRRRVLIARASRGGRLRPAADRERRRRLSAGDARRVPRRCSTASAPTAARSRPPTRCPTGGTAIMLGGDILGLDVAQAMAATGHRVILMPSEQTFSPHRVDDGGPAAAVRGARPRRDRGGRGRRRSSGIEAAATAARRARSCSPTAASSRATW